VRLKTSLMCPMCGRQTSHELHYVGTTLHEIRCLQCSTETWGHHHPISHYLAEMRGRIISKPTRLLKEMSGHPERVRSLATRAVSKPARVASEFIEILR
jgi:hypothetical protein